MRKDNLALVREITLKIGGFYQRP